MQDSFIDVATVLGVATTCVNNIVLKLRLALSHSTANSFNQYVLFVNSMFVTSKKTQHKIAVFLIDN